MQCWSKAGGGSGHVKSLERRWVKLCPVRRRQNGDICWCVCGSSSSFTSCELSRFGAFLLTYFHLQNNSCDALPHLVKFFISCRD